MIERDGVNLPASAADFAALAQEWLLRPLGETRVRDLIARALERQDQLDKSALEQLARMLIALNVAKQSANALEGLLVAIENRS